MNPERLQILLERVRDRELGIAQALAQLRDLPFEDLGFAKVDHHRALRRGFPEVIMGEGKNAEEIAAIIKSMRKRKSNVLVTRIAPEKFLRLKKLARDLTYHPAAKSVTWTGAPVNITGRGTILVVCAGTSDIGVAEEAVITAGMMGNRVEKLYDVGVAGIHRVLENRLRFDAASVVIVVAGMEGALPSVVAGLIAKPVIAVPTSIGYGASFGGLAALLGMLNSCAGGVTVVNIDNGFGAGFAASLINRV